MKCATISKFKCFRELNTAYEVCYSCLSEMWSCVILFAVATSSVDLRFENLRLRLYRAMMPCHANAMPVKRKTVPLSASGIDRPAMVSSNPVRFHG